MRVVLVTHEVARSGGQPRVNYVLTRYLLERGHQVHLIVRSVDHELYRFPRFSATVLPIPARPTIVEQALFMLLAAVALRWAPQQAIVVNNGTAMLATSDVNYCHFCHSSYRRAPRDHTQTRTVRTIGRSLYHVLLENLDTIVEQLVYHRRSRTVVAVSTLLRDELVHAAHVDSRRITVIPNGVDTGEFFPPAGEKQRLLLRTQLGLPNTPLLFFAGDLRTRRKGLDTVLRALATLPGEVRLLVAGDDNSSPYPDQVQVLGLADRVIFLGFRSDVSLLMRAVDIFVFPSQYEAASLVVLEAMASGLPVITTPAAGSSEAITDGVNGLLLHDPHDHETAAQLIAGLLDSLERRESLGYQARQTALEYDWSRIMVKAEALLAAHAAAKGFESTPQP